MATNNGLKNSESLEVANILLVDDTPANLLALSAILGDPSYRLLQASSGPEALGLLLKHEVAAVLLDVMMADMNGFEVAEAMKKREQTRHVPIIFVTAVAHELTDIYRGYSVGAVDYIQKPLDPDVVRAKVAVFVDLFRKEKKIQRQQEIIRDSERAQSLERERAARHVAEAAERRFRGLVNSLDHAIIWEADSSLRDLSFVSARAEKLLGYPHREWMLTDDFFLEHIHPDDRKRFLAVLEKAKYDAGDGMGERCDHRMIASDGTERWFHTGVQADKDEAGSIVRLRGLSVDINPLKNVEYALRESEERLAFALDAADMGIWDWNLMTGALTWSDTLQALWGYEPGEFTGSMESFWSRIHPDDKARVDEALQNAFEKREDYNIEYRVVWEDGSIHWIYAKGRMFFDAYSKPMRMSGTAINVDARKRSEDKLNKALALREEVLAIVSHDLKNPLSAIQLSTGLLRRLAIPDSNQAQMLKSQIDTIQRTSARMRRLIDDLLDLAKLEDAALPMERHELSAEGLLDEAISILKPLALEKSITIDKKVSSPEIKAWCDHERILQVFSNILGNAIKFTPEGGHIEIGARAFGEAETLFFVRDSGPGIPADELPNVFTRFWQARETMRDGTGLGLSIAKGIVIAHGGRIWVESEPGRGAIFYFTVFSRHDGASASSAA